MFCADIKASELCIKNSTGTTIRARVKESTLNWFKVKKSWSRYKWIGNGKKTCFPVVGDIVEVDANYRSQESRHVYNQPGVEKILYEVEFELKKRYKDEKVKGLNHKSMTLSKDKFEKISEKAVWSS